MDHRPFFMPEIQARPFAPAIEAHLMVMDAIYKKRIKEQESQNPAQPTEEGKSGFAPC